MAWNDAAETLVGTDGEVYVAPVGTALPANADSVLAAAFEGLGYHNEDGLTKSNSPSIKEHAAWQSAHPIRIDREAEEFTIAFNLLQHTEVSIPLAFGGGEIVDLGSSQYRYNPPEPGDSPDYRSVVADVDDGDRRVRIIIPRGLAVEDVESQFTRSEMAVLPITIRATQPDEGGDAWYELYNDAASFAAGS